MSRAIEISDEELFARIKQGDQYAFTLVYTRYNKLLYVLAFRYLMDKDKAEDVVQYVFLRLWEYRSALVVEVSLKNFLFTMAKNHVLNIIRNENKAIEKQYEMAQQASEFADDLIDKLEKREQMSLFYKALSNLSNRKREICLMKVREGMSNLEIAERTGLSVNTVKTHYVEAIKYIRRYLNQMLIFIIGFLLFIKLSV
ncbi:RNA polymerase sigma factor [Phocaeicola coprocola]|uniref:RNA polymerase sigma factor n=1 Tax=Phocaeicola coprocola TaxID=310298 RepID=UPI0026703D8F|nr:sigma-70 family RNA polymerase sigma factor [Phocaeicola coprocola]